MHYKVKEVAELAGISVRTLHHYDQINLLVPKRIGENAYRVYSQEDLLLLQQILFFRELDFSLDTIKRIISDPGYEGADALLRQRNLLIKKKERLDKIILTLDQTIATRKEGEIMEKRKMFEAFDMKEMEEQRKKYAAEVEEKWGGTDAYQESSRKTKSYTEEDWVEIKREADDIYHAIASSMDLKPSDPFVQDLVHRWQQHITNRYYKCSKEILAGLGENYVDDERFKKNIDKYGEGLAVFFRDAIRVYCS